MELHHNHAGRPKRSIRTASRSFYTQFKKEHPEFKKLKFKEFIKIIREINQEYSKIIVDEAKVVALPYGLANICINRYKGKLRKVEGYSTYEKFRAIDWGASDKANLLLPEGSQKVIIYHYNDHTDGYVCKWWYYIGSQIWERDIWKCYPMRVPQQYLSQKIKEVPDHYQKFKTIKNGEIY